MEKLVQSIIATLTSFADPDRKTFAERSFPSDMKMLGVTNPNMKKVVQNIKKETKDFSHPQKIALAQALIDTHIFECQFVVYEWLGRDRKILKEITAAEVKNLMQNLDNWVSVDTLSMGLLGAAWRLGIVDDLLIEQLLHSNDLWLRRTGLVATVGLNLKSRGGTGDTKRTLWACTMLKSDHEKMIIKAMSWALRELAKHDEKAVQDFLQKHQTELHKQVIREVEKKIQTGKK